MEFEAPRDLIGWYAKHASEINAIEALLAVPLSNEPGRLNNHIAELSVQQGVLSRLLADAESILTFTEEQQLLDRDPEKTDLDRNIRMKAATINPRRIVNILKGFSKALRNKLIASMSQRKCLYGEPSGGYQG